MCLLRCTAPGRKVDRAFRSCDPDIRPCNFTIKLMNRFSIKAHYNKTSRPTPACTHWRTRRSERRVVTLVVNIIWIEKKYIIHHNILMLYWNNLCLVVDLSLSLSELIHYLSQLIDKRNYNIKIIVYLIRVPTIYLTPEIVKLNKT